MEFVEEQQPAAVHAVAARIGQELRAGQRVLWLVSGGSNVAAEVAVMSELRQQAAERLPGLAILPMDERYGAPGHEHSNTQALRAAGFDPGTAVWIDILAHNVPLDQTVDFYNDLAVTLLGSAGAVIGQFGLGSDGHIAGLLPHSPAPAAGEMMVTGYEWSDYTRLSLTPGALRRATVAYVLAYGSAKQSALTRLRQRAEPPSDLPAVVLYDIPEVHIYTDNKLSEEKT